VLAPRSSVDNVFSSSGSSGFLDPHRWQMSINYRFFNSHRHFIGKKDQDERNEFGTEVRNIVHIVDYSITYSASPRLNFTLSLPFQYTRRAQPGLIIRDSKGILRATPGIPDRVSNADGLGDISFTGRYWLLKGGNERRQNVAIGLGIKLPTGDASSTNDVLVGGKRIKNVVNDQSIQAGDGGTGLIMEVQGYKGVGPVTFYASATYLSNPKEKKTMRTFTSPDLTPPALAAQTGEKFLSIGDQYSIRIGGIVPLPHLKIFRGMAISMGLRDEGQPPPTFSAAIKASVVPVMPSR